MTTHGETSVITKTFEVIEHLASVPGDQLLAEIGDATGLPKPTVHLILRDLVQLGYVDRHGTGMYQIADKFESLTTSRRDRALKVASRPAMEKFHRAAGRETVCLGVLRNDLIVYVDIIESTHAVRRFVDLNETQPFYVSALGRAIVAHLPARRRNHLLKHTRLEPVTPHTVTDPTKFRAILRQVARDGYAVEFNQAEEEIGCVAAPIFNGAGVVAAVSVTVPLTRLDDRRCRRLIPVVRSAAAQLSNIITSEKKEAS